MAKKATPTSKGTTPKKESKVSGSADLPVVTEDKPKKTSKKLESEAKVSSKAKSTKSAKEETVTNKKVTTKVKTKASDNAINEKPAKVAKPDPKTKKKPDIAKIEVLEAKSETKKVTKKVTEDTVAIVEAPKKRSNNKKDTEVKEKSKPSAVKEKKAVAKNEPVASGVEAKSKHATKKSKVETDSFAKLDLLKEKVTDVKAEVETQPTEKPVKAKTSISKTPKIRASEVQKSVPVEVPAQAKPVVAVESATSITREVTSQPLPAKFKNKKKVAAVKIEAQKPEAVVSKAHNKPQQATISPAVQPLMSKSARRRAKKKAKKLREQAVLVQQNVTAIPDNPTITTVPLPKQANQVAKSSAPVEQTDTKSKKWEKRKNKNTFIANSQQNIAPIYSTQANETANVIQEKTDGNTTEKAQYISHRKLQPKPIPWADLSKFKDERKPIVIKEQSENVPIDVAKLLSSSQRRDPFFQNFYRDVEKFVISEMLIENGSKVLVAVSGGVDSVVMLDVFANLSAKYNFIVYVAHYNHNLRGEASNNDVQFVKELAASYNLPFYSSTGKVLQHAERTGMSIEESARFLRYYFLERTACTLKTDFVATAHTADDSAETFLLNLFRGTGLTGLSGIPTRRQMVKDVIIIRPFLNFSKQKLKEYAEKRDLEWHEDETNLQDKYTRNKIRNDLIPKLKSEYTQSITDVINRSAKLIQGADRIIHNYVKTHLPSILFDISNESISIKLTLFKTFDEFIRGEMLQTILMKYFKLLPIPMKIIDRIIKLEQAENSAICEISKNIIAIKDRQTLIISRKIVPNKISQKIEKKGKFTIGSITLILKEINVNDVEFTKNPCIEYVDADIITNTLLIRNWEHGDDFNPLGMENTMKLSDFLINEKVSILEKPNVLVLTNNNNEIIWVCKHRIGNKFRVTPNTRKVLQIEMKEK